MLQVHGKNNQYNAGGCSPEYPNCGEGKRVSRRLQDFATLTRKNHVSYHCSVDENASATERFAAVAADPRKLRVHVRKESTGYIITLDW